MKTREIVGWLGVITLNLSPILAIISVTMHYREDVGQIMSVCLFVGLLLIGIRSLLIKDWLNTLNCLIGASLNAMLYSIIN